MDLESDFLWKITTAEGGLQIKHGLKRRLKKWDMNDICGKLSQYNIKIPDNAVDSAFIDTIHDKIMGV